MVRETRRTGGSAMPTWMRRLMTKVNSASQARRRASARCVPWRSFQRVHSLALDRLRHR